MTLDQIGAFFGWCLIINSGILGLTTIVMLLGDGWVSRFHGKLFDLSEGSVKSEHFSFLSRYKLLVLVFNMTPYIALKIIQASA